MDTSYTGQVPLILIRCSTDLHYAARQGAVDCMHLHSGLQPNDLVQNGIDGPDMAENGPRWISAGQVAGAHPNQIGRKRSALDLACKWNAE